MTVHVYGGILQFRFIEHQPTGTFVAAEWNGFGAFVASNGVLEYTYTEGAWSERVRIPLATNFAPATMRAFKQRIYRVVDRLARLTLPTERRIRNMDQDMAMRSALRNTKSKESASRKAGKVLEYVPARVLPEDKETVEAIANRFARDQGFIIRAAVHMFCEAYRRNPQALDL